MKRERRGRLVSVAAYAGVSAVVAATLLVSSARWFWLGEIAASFAWHLGWASLGGALLLAITQRPRLALAVLVLSIWHVWAELSLWLPDARAGEPETSVQAELSIVSCNLLWPNERYDAVRAWAEQAAPDVVVCLEVSLAWREQLESWGDLFPHQLYSREGPWTETSWGTAILSRLPFESTRLIPVDSAQLRPPMECVVLLDDRPVTIRGAHTMRAGAAWRLELRDSVLATLGREEWDPTGILAGDLNITSSSPVFGDLLDASGLRDSRRGFGRQPSWRLERILPGLEFAIDHVLVGDGLHVLERRVEAVPGSDHRAVLTRLALR